MVDEKLRLWRLFIVGRSAVTGVFLALLLIINGFALTNALRPLFFVAGIQFVANAAYLYFWRRHDLTLLGQLCFIAEIVLITLLIVAFGSDGHVFLLAYLWPIMMGGWLVGHRAITSLTLLSSLAYALILVLQRSGTIASQHIVTADGTSQALLLSLPYLAFVALLVWALTTEIEHGEVNLNQRNQELGRINAKLRSLVAANEEVLSCRRPQQLLVTAVSQVERIAECSQVAIYVKDSDQLQLRQQRGLPEAFGQQRRQRPIPNEWLQTNGNGNGSEAVIRESLDDSERNMLAQDASERPSALLHVPLRSVHGLEGMLTIAATDAQPVDKPQTQLLQILGHQLGIALENAHLFDDLGHERDRLSSILANMGEAVFVADGENRVLLANRAAESLLDVRENEALPGWLTQQIEERGDSTVGRQDRQLIEHQDRSIRLSVSELSGAGVQASTIYVARDITREAEVERMKSDFVAYASHEMRTPLTTIKMLVRLLLMDAPSESKGAEYLDVINTQVDRQRRLIDNLLDFARLEAGRYELPPEEVDPRQVVHSVMGVVQPLAHDKGVELDVSCPDVAEAIESNGNGLEQVLLNLLSNAIKYTDKGGLVQISYEKDDGEVQFVVEDTGIGLTQEQLERIFDKFYTVYHPRKQGEGTGLGLAISDMIIRQLGGRIDVTSELGHGSRFVVHVPVAACEVMAV